MHSCSAVAGSRLPYADAGAVMRDTVQASLPLGVAKRAGTCEGSSPSQAQRSVLGVGTRAWEHKMAGGGGLNRGRVAPGQTNQIKNTFTLNPRGNPRDNGEVGASGLLRPVIQSCSASRQLPGCHGDPGTAPLLPPPEQYPRYT
ncbi:hypothetical protein E2C01_064621 [Portunus trituberculatus]|uniref:Uncharacterized protein n=1 Tax=Portunus trituberculatus TaxID=210409 RepID=A0A5B7HLB2_PORTR|nr:hypothetical protein [Portunus trituberculatus]